MSWNFKEREKGKNSEIYILRNKKELKNNRSHREWSIHIIQLLIQYYIKFFIDISKIFNK